MCHNVGPHKRVHTRPGQLRLMLVQDIKPLCTLKNLFDAIVEIQRQRGLSCKRIRKG